jgi:hypothetical protein
MGRKGKVHNPITMDQQDYSPCKYFQQIYTNRKNLNVARDGFMEVPIELGCFEVYFLEILLFSKKITN